MATKPRYTPDPPPEVLDEKVRAYLDTQFQRIYDLWPKDLEDRLKYLEERWPYRGGNWTIVDPTSCVFTAEAVQLYVNKGFIYSSTGTSAYITDGDYQSFDTLTSPISGFTSFETLKQNGLGQAVAITHANADLPVYQTSDGETWSTSNPSGVYGTKGIVWHNNKWIVVGGVTTPFNYGFACVSSSDAVTWTTEFSQTARDYEPADFHALASNGSRLVCACNNYLTGGRIAYSDDNGATWTDYAAPGAGTYSPHSMWYAGGYWYYACYGRAVYYSTTGLSGSWTLLMVLGAAASRFTQIEHGDGVWMFVSDDNVTASQDYIYRSTSGTSVPSANLAIQTPVAWHLSYDPTYGWFYASQDQAAYSTNGGVSWQQTNLGSPLGISARGFFRMNVAV